MRVYRDRNDRRALARPLLQLSQTAGGERLLSLDLTQPTPTERTP